MNIQASKVGLVAKNLTAGGFGANGFGDSYVDQHQTLDLAP